MFPQSDPAQARYLAEILLSVIGVLILLGVVFWMIGKRKKAQLSQEKPDLFASNSNNVDQNVDPLTALWGAWQRDHLLISEDGKSLFVRTGVEKNGLRYQLTSTTQAQGLAVYALSLLTDKEPNARQKVEALFASLLAHPAYGEANLSSWKFFPDLPRSPKLDADLKSDAWAMIGLLKARKHHPSMDRFDYAEIIPQRLEVLYSHWQPHDDNFLAFEDAFLLETLEELDPKHSWKSLLSQVQPALEMDWQDNGLGLLQIGLNALLHDDAASKGYINQNRENLLTTVQAYLDQPFDGSEQEDFSRLAWLASALPALQSLAEPELLTKVNSYLLETKAKKDDGLGATIKLIALTIGNQTYGKT